MADEQNPGEGSEKPRRFKLGRKVKNEPQILSREEQEMKALEEMGDEALKGTPEEDASLRQGCTGCLRVFGLLLVIMLASIITTWCIRR